MAAPDTPNHSLVDECLADLGHLVRRAEAQSLDEQSFQLLTRRLRKNLKAMRAEEAELFTIELTDDGLAELARHPVPNFPVLPTGVRARRVGRLAVIDCGGSPDTPERGA